MNTFDNDNTQDMWECPHCKHNHALIIQDSVLKNDYREILCGCYNCEELFIRQYKFEKIIKLTRNE